MYSCGEVIVINSFDHFLAFDYFKVIRYSHGLNTQNPG